MECNPKIPGQITPIPLFPDGRGELIDVLMPSKICKVESNFLDKLVKKTIKKNRPKIDCKKPQKSIDRGGGTPSTGPYQPYPPGGKEWPGGFPPDPPPPGTISPTIYSDNNNWYLLRYQFSMNGQTFYNWLWCWYGTEPILRRLITTEGKYQGHGAFRDGATVYEIDGLRLAKIFIIRDWVYAQGFASPINSAYLRGKNLYFIPDSELPVSIDEIERTMGRETPFYMSSTQVSQIEITVDPIMTVYFARSACVTIDSSSGAMMCYSGNYSIGVPVDHYPYSFFINGLPVNESTPEIPSTNDGDNGMTNKDDCCCDCVEAIASVMEAYMEKIAPMFEDLKKYIDRRLVEETNEIKKYMDKQLYAQSEFIQKQILELEDQQIDFTPVINQIKTTEQNLWTGSTLKIDASELPKEEK